MGGDDRAGDSCRQVKHGKQISLGKCRKIHAAGSGPSGLGIMQPEGRPQQGKLKTKAKGIHATGTDPCGLGIMQPEGRSQLKRAWKMSPGCVDEVELVQLKACVAGMTRHEPPGP